MADSRRTALLSAWNKDGVAGFAAGLAGMGWTLYASGGTRAALMAAGVDAVHTETITGVESLLGGRVKTLHPELHAAILAAGADREERVRGGRVVFDLVAVDLYPFQESHEFGPEDAGLVELIDIGGPAMARGAAKNWTHVISAVGRDIFGTVLDAVRTGQDDAGFRRRMAARTFDITSRYDMQVSLSLERGLVPPLRYGENPHQQACVHFTSPPCGFGLTEVLGGTALSYNNYLDAAAAWDLTSSLPAEVCSAVLLKHGNPCGAGIGWTAAEAFAGAFRADRVSPYGGILALNCPVDEGLAVAIKDLFLEMIMAPEYEPETLRRLLKRKKLRVLRMPPWPGQGTQVRSIPGGLLFQDGDPADSDPGSWEPVTRRRPTAEELRALDLAWRVCRSVKSNAIVIGDARGVLGVGAGQMSRIESLDLAVRRALREGHRLEGASLASDGYFPFRDGPDAAAAAGISAIVQPGGSMRDSEVVQAADDHGIAMLFTGTRHFRH
jgi:phosphoribosylaminoimidazolecarboxamide formyltransferase / IMP cyclohydrolase